MECVVGEQELAVHDKAKNEMIRVKGRVHSVESFGTKDGPGIRFVFFLQGCPLRCLYCHNPDTWIASRTTTFEITALEAFQEVLKVRDFVSGGITVSGGEPLFQPDFILDLFKLCRSEGIHTAVDTSGIFLNDRVKEVLEYTDLVLLDVKQINPERYKVLTSQPLQPTLRFLDYLDEIGKPIWMRYVLVPGYSNDPKDLHEWAKYVAGYPTVERVDILPFHQMGLQKWQELGEPYRLAEVQTPTNEELQQAEAIFKSYGLPVI